MTESSAAETGVSAKPEQGSKDSERLQAEAEKESEKPKVMEEKKSRLNEEIKSMLLFTATSLIAGYLSFLLTPARPAFIPVLSLLSVFAIMMAIFAGTRAIVRKIAGKKETQWIMGNGGAIYLFLWFVSWIIFYNVL